MASKFTTVISIVMLHILSGWQVYGQSSYRFRHLGVDDGLAYENVESIAEDGLGFIWFQNSSGISRYDGYNFRTYKYDTDDSLKLPGGGRNGRFLVDPQGNIWITHGYQGMGPEGQYILEKYDRKSDAFKLVPVPLAARKMWRHTVRFDKQEPLIWIGTYGEGLYSFNPETGDLRNYVNKDSDSITNEEQNSYSGIQDRGDHLLLGTFGGLRIFDKATHAFSRPACNPKDSAILLSESVVSFFDRAGSHYADDLWIMLSGHGVVRINADFSIVDQFDYNYSSLYYDISEDGVFWIALASEDGVLRYDPKDRSTRYLKKDPKDPFSLSSDHAWDVLLDRNQNLWVATNAGVDVMPHSSLRFSNHPLKNKGSTALFRAGKNDFVVTVVNPSDKDAIQMARVSPTELDRLPFTKVLTDEVVPLTQIHGLSQGKSHFWIGDFEKGVFGIPISSKTGMMERGPLMKLNHNPKNPFTIATDNVMGVLEDPKGNVWIGTASDGLYKVTSTKNYGKEGSITRFTHDATNPNSIASDQSTTPLLLQTDSSLWIYTDVGIDLLEERGSSAASVDHVFRKGVIVSCVFKASDGTVYFGTENGLYASRHWANGNSSKKELLLKNIEVHSIAEDKLGRIWISNPAGVVCYDLKANVQIVFDGKDGIDYSGAPNMYTTSDGIMVTSNGDGISLFDPATLQIDSGEVSPVLTQLEVNNVVPPIANVFNTKEDFLIPKDISVLEQLLLDYKHNNFSIEFAALEMTAPRKNLYRYKLEGYDKDWIKTDWKNRTAKYTNLPFGDYTFEVKASSHHGVWSDGVTTMKVKILPPPWRTWWAYVGYWALGAGLLVLARRTIVQRERLKANLQLEHVELEKAKEVDRVKTSFFTNISHEFRTPLTLIRGPVETLLDRFKDDPDVIQRLKLVQRNSDLLLRLINQLLDLAKLESGTLRVEKSEGDVYSFVRAIASSFESFARQKNITLEVTVPAEVYSALFDKDKVETILINLINNAIKFTPSGGSVTVSVPFDSGPPTTDHRSPITLCVKDTGIGIPPEHQTKVFERFHQVSEAHKEVGTGIGLSLVKELVTLMEGTITVESEVGKGTAFTVTLPIESGDVEGAIVADSSAQHPPPNTQHLVNGISNIENRISNDEVDSTKPQVLVVEDNSDLRAFIIDSLGSEFQFHEAENGKQGLAIATEQIPDMIISDVMMPEMDGMEMTRKIKEDIKTSHIPLILLTAKSGEDSKLEGLSKGADDYLTKPFNKEELLLKVRNGTARMQKIREKLKVEVLSMAPAIEVQSEDEQFLQKVKETIIERMSDEQLSVESLADDMGMSRVQLYRKVSALTGMAVNELIRKLRLQRAAQLISQNWGPVSQVAYEVGFSNLSYFSKVFKEEFDVLPSEYEKV